MSVKYIFLDRTSKPNKLSFKGAISDQEPNEKESMSESDDGGLSFLKRTVRRSANTINKSKSKCKKNALRFNHISLNVHNRCLIVRF